MKQNGLTRDLTALVDAGLLTLTSGVAGEPDATYALAWLPLDGDHPQDVVEQHARNMARLANREQ